MNKRSRRIWNTFYVAVMIILMLALFDSLARSEPYLMYNPTVKILKYEVEVNGEVLEVQPNIVNDQMQLVYDLENLPVGASAIRARAQFELWGWCEWSEPYTVIRPGPLQNPQIVTNP